MYARTNQDLYHVASHAPMLFATLFLLAQAPLASSSGLLFLIPFCSYLILYLYRLLSQSGCCSLTNGTLASSVSLKLRLLD